MRRLSLAVLFFSIALCLVFFKPDNGLLVNYLPTEHPEVIQVERMIDRTGAYVPVDTRKKIALAIVSNGKYYNIPYKHLVAIAYVESTFRPDFVNDTDDWGIMQINWHHWGKRFTNNKKDLLNVYKNVEFACRVININKSMGFKNLAAYHSLNPVDQATYDVKLKNALRRI